jgi:hypothetical protein
MTDSNNLVSGLAKQLRKESGKSGAIDYFDRFQKIDQYLNEKVHPKVNEGAAVAGQTGSATWLTDHGPEHVATVIRHASAMVRADAKGQVLSAEEAYLLLLAIHFHDVGNVYGRNEHEKKIALIMEQLGEPMMGDNALQKRMILNIATAHGGYIDGDKDTIRLALQSYDLRAKKPPRPHLLAAVLRFADELADDHSRASQFAISAEGKSMVAGSEVYHMYADRLQEVTVDMDEGAVRLRFELSEDHVLGLYSKGAAKVGLFDEIRDRLLKLFKEFLYCRGYLLPAVHFDRIEIEIGVFTNNFMTELMTERFTLRETGYPEYPTDLASVCADLRLADGGIKDGAWLTAQLKLVLAADATL